MIKLHRYIFWYWNRNHHALFSPSFTQKSHTCMTSLASMSVSLMAKWQCDTGAIYCDQVGCGWLVAVFIKVHQGRHEFNIIYYNSPCAVYISRIDY